MTKNPQKALSENPLFFEPVENPQICSPSLKFHPWPSETRLFDFLGRRESNLEKGLLKIEELEVADEEAGAQGGRGRHQALLQSEVMDCRELVPNRYL
jgi:hypothetical protein